MFAIVANFRDNLNVIMDTRELVIKLNYCILDAPVARNRAMLCLKCSIESLFIVQKVLDIIYKYIYV